MTSYMSDEIIKLLSEGKNSGDIIGMGYKKGTVYSTQRKWRQGKIKLLPKVEKVATGSGKSNHLSVTALKDIESLLRPIE